MGFSKKSWLALVLAIVMVLGMAMPTAFAAPVVPEAITFKNDAGDSVGASEEGFLPLYLGDGVTEISMFNEDTELTKDGLGETPVVTFLDLPAGVTAAVNADGKLELSGQKVILEPVSFTVCVNPPADKKFTTEKVYESDIYVQVLPVVSLVASTPITLDIQPGKDTIMLNAASFKSNYEGKIEFVGLADDDAPLGSAAALTDADYGDGIVSLNSYGTYSAKNALNLQIAAKKVGSIELPIVAKVNDLPAKPFNVRLVVGNTGDDNGYKVGTSVASITTKINGLANSFKFTAYPANVEGKAIVNGELSELTVDTSDLEIDKVEIDGAEAEDTQVTGALNADGEVELTVGKYVRSAKGQIVINGTSNGSALLPAYVDVDIQPLKLKSSVTNGLTFDIQTRKPDVVKYISFTTADGEFLAAAIADPFAAEAGVTATLPETLEHKVDATNTVAKVNWTLTTAADATVSSGKIEASAFLKSKATATTRAGFFPTEVIKVPYGIVNNDSKNPTTMTTTITKLEFDLAGQEADKIKTVLFVPGNFLAKAPETPVLSSAAFKLDGKEELKGLTAEFGDYNATKKGYELTVDATACTEMFTGELSIDGKIDGIAFTQKKIQIVVDNKVAGGAHHITASTMPTDIPANTIITAPLQVNVFDYVPTAVTGAEITLGMADADKVALDAGDRYATFTQQGTTQKWVVVITKPGAGYITVDASAKDVSAQTLYIPFNVTKTVISPSTTNISLDMVEDAKNTATLTFTANGKITMDDPVADGLAFVRNEEKSTDTSIVIDVTGTDVTKRGKFSLTGMTVDGYDAEDINFTYAVANTSAIKWVESAANEGQLLFSMEDGGKTEDVLTFAPNPGDKTLTITGYKSSDESVLKIEERSKADHQYAVTALKDGTGIVTISGKIGAYEVEDLLIQFTVGKAQAPKLKLKDDADLTKFDIKTLEPINTLEITVQSEAGLDTTDVVFTVPTNGIIEVTGAANPYTVKALKAGEGTLTINAKVNGVDAEPLKVPVKVINSEIPDYTGISIPGATRNAAGEYDLKLSADKAANVYTIVAYNLDGTKAADGGVWKSLAKAVATVEDSKKAESKLTLLKAGKVKITYTFTEAAKAVAKTELSITINVTPLKFDTATLPATAKMLAGERRDFVPTISPAGAITKGYKYSLDKAGKKIASVNKYGVVTAKAGKEGIALLTATPKYKKDNLPKLQCTITIVKDWSTANYYAAYLFAPDMAAPVIDKNAVEIATILSTAAYKAGATPNPALDLSTITSEAELYAKLAEIQGNLLPNDVFTLFYSGAADASGNLKVGTQIIDLTKLAAALSKIDCNVVVYLDSTLSNRFYNTKGANFDAQVKTAFAKAAKIRSALYPLKASEKSNLHVITATTTKKGSVALSADGTAFTKAFVTALGTTLAADKSGDKYVTMAELYSYLYKTAKVKVGVWPSKSDALVVYGKQAAAAPIVP